MARPNYQIIDKIGMPHVLDFVVEQLAGFDTSELDWVKLLPLEQKTLLHGACDFPYDDPSRARVKKHGYRIRASVNVKMPPPFEYEHWARIPHPNRQGWRSGEKTFRFADLEECALHTLAHECFHFLADSAQLAQKNTEANANWWADKWLDAFREFAGPVSKIPGRTEVPAQLSFDFGG